MIGWRYVDLQADLKTISQVTGQDAMIKRLINNAVGKVGASYDWPFLWTTEDFATIAPYTTGTCAVTNGSATVTGTSTVWTAAMEGRKFRFAGNAAYYTVKTRNSNTSLTLEQNYQDTTSTSGTYSIFKDEYLLNADVDKYKLLRQVSSPSTLFSKHVSDFDLSHPAPQGQGSAFYEIYTGRAVKTYATGTVSISASGRVITGVSTVWTGVEGLTRGTKLVINNIIFTVKVVNSDTSLDVYEVATTAQSAQTYTALLDNPLVQVYPIPDAAENIYYRYQRIPAVLDADGDLPDLPPDMHDLVMEYCLATLWEHKGFGDRAQASRALFGDLLNKAILHHGQSNPDRSYRRRSADRYGNTPLPAYDGSYGWGVG